MAFGSSDVDATGALTGAGHADATNGIALNRKRAVHPAVDVEFTIGDESTNVRVILVQMKDAFGNDVGEEVIYDLYVLNGASNVLATTGGSTGIADGGVGAILDTRVAKLVFECITDATGLSDFDWTDTATESVRLAVKLPNGNVVVSEAFANA